MKEEKNCCAACEDGESTVEHSIGCLGCPNMDKPKVNAGHYHEIMDRAHIINTMIEEFLIDHPGMNDGMNRLCWQAQSDLMGVYSMASDKIEPTAASEE